MVNENCGDGHKKTNEEEIQLHNDTKATKDCYIEEGRYGWLGFTPNWLQRINNPKGFLVALSLFSLCQGFLVNGIVDISITSLERRFELSSFEAGIISCSYDIAFCCLCLFVTYYGTHANKPRLIAIGSLILCVGAIIFTVPHYATDTYVYKDEFDKCDSNRTDNCGNKEVQENLHKYFYILILSQLTLGVGSTPAYTLGFAFLEGSVGKEQLSVYLGIANSVTILAAATGYIGGGFLMKKYVDFDSVDTESLELTPDDPRWIGAWWVGGLITAAMSVTLVSGLLFGFPKKLPGTAKNRASRVSEVHLKSSAEITEQLGFGKSWKDFPTAFLVLLKNPTFILTTLACCSEGLVSYGVATFLPKFIQNEFNRSAGNAAFITGAVSVPGGIVGNLFAGFIVRRFNMGTSALLKFCAGCCLAVICLSPAFLMHCGYNIAGVTTPYSDSETVSVPSNLMSSCNIDCKCQEEIFMPVCGDDRKVYFSACQAGCSMKNWTTGGKKYFTGCSCVHHGNGTAFPGVCEHSCDLIAPFLLILFLLIMFNFMSTAPAMVATFRCVPNSQRPFAIGVQWLFLRGLGCVPAPILCGAILDTTCLLWQKKTCNGGRGSCWIYDNEGMSLNMFGIALVGKVLSVVFFLLSWYMYKPLETSIESPRNGIAETDDVRDNEVGGKKDTKALTNELNGNIKLALI